MIKIIRSILLATTALAMGACGWFAPAEASNNSLIADLPALGLSIQVKNSTDVFNTVGQIINYNYVIAYTGQAALSGPVTVTDAQGIVTCPDVATVGNFNGSLDQNETITCTSSYALTQADLTTGSVTKNATAIVGGVSSNAASIVTPTALNKILTLTKSANPASYGQAGAIITYTYTIKNSGSVTIGPAQFTVTDDHMLTPINCGANTVTLLPTETVICTATYTIAQADMNAAGVTNNATASGGGVGPSQSVSATVNNTTVVQNNPSNLTSGTTIQHQVTSGEWLIQIARCYGANFTEVRNANTHITDPNVVLIDQTVTVPRIGSAGKIYGKPCITSHTVQSGDTWASIAQRYNADIVVLQAANSGSLLSAGSVLKIPLNSSTGVITIPVPTLTPTVGIPVVPTVTLTAAPTDAIRITFAQGTTAATINGTVELVGTIRYLVSGTQGQEMKVLLSSTPPNEIAWAVYNPSGLALRPLDANPSWTGILPETGDYRIEILNIQGTTSKSFTLSVSIAAPAAPGAP
ncbi:MAG: LysM peptidoglycan-binding domain-containing protein [Anaerolineales bacterium]|nr:LysM peptidoglycan-binding domain-containing protein [Anaerolineales bacterium]